MNGAREYAQEVPTLEVHIARDFFFWGGGGGWDRTFTCSVSTIKVFTYMYLLCSLAIIIL